MRRHLLFAVGPLLALAGCYNPGDLGDTPFKCTSEFPECPDNYTCQLNPNVPNVSFCVRTSSLGGAMGGSLQVEVPKTGPAYTGTHQDLGLSAAHCPASTFGFGLSDAFPLDGNASVPETFLCLPGESDVYHVALSQAQYVRVQVAYKIVNGDLDLAFLDGHGTVVASDGSARDNACLVTSAPVAGLDLAVVGAGGSATNQYAISAETSLAPLACP